MTCKNCNCEECNFQSNTFESDYYKIVIYNNGRELGIIPKTGIQQGIYIIESLPLLEKAIARAKELRGE